MRDSTPNFEEVVDETDFTSIDSSAETFFRRRIMSLVARDSDPSVDVWCDILAKLDEQRDISLVTLP